MLQLVNVESNLLFSMNHPVPFNLEEQVKLISDPDSMIKHLTVLVYHYSLSIGIRTVPDHTIHSN